MPVVKTPAIRHFLVKIKFCMSQLKSRNFQLTLSIPAVTGHFLVEVPDWVGAEILQGPLQVHVVELPVLNAPVPPGV